MNAQSRLLTWGWGDARAFPDDEDGVLEGLERVRARPQGEHDADGRGEAPALRGGDVVHDVRADHRELTQQGLDDLLARLLVEHGLHQRHEHHQEGEQGEERVVGDLGAETALAVDAGLVDGAPQDVEESGARSQLRDPGGQRPGHRRDPNEQRSGAFEVAGQLPVGHAAVERHPLLAGAVEQVEVDLFAEGTPWPESRTPTGRWRRRCSTGCRGGRGRRSRCRRRRRRLDLVADAVQAAGDRGREGQVGVGVAARDAALDPRAVAVADLAEARACGCRSPSRRRSAPTSRAGTACSC